MAGLNETPRANRVHIAFFGLRNAGKSTLANAFAGQPVAIVSDTPGTTTDPVSKAMEILPLGPCLVTDTAGLDDTGELGRMRVEKTLKVLETVDIAVWVRSAEDDAAYRTVADVCARRKTALLEYRRGDSVEDLKRRIAAVKLVDVLPGLLEGMVGAGDRVVCVCPIDESAPKGRLILPQQQVIRECLGRHVPCTVCQPQELADSLKFVQAELRGRALVVTDSQAFASVRQTLSNLPNPPDVSLTSFSILFARQKGDVAAYEDGLRSLSRLKDGDRVIVAEGCTHRRQCNDIGTVKIPKALERLTGRRLAFEFRSGTDFPDLAVARPALVVQCGGCMLTRREMLARIASARAAGVPVVNYGMLLAAAAGVGLTQAVRGK